MPYSFVLVRTLQTIHVASQYFMHRYERFLLVKDGALGICLSQLLMRTFSTEIRCN